MQTQLRNSPMEQEKHLNSKSPLLSEKFLNKYKNKNVPWGFGILGYIVFKRTYARLLETGKTEEWPQTIQRCIEGAQKIGAGYTAEEAERLFDHLFNLRCNFGGRMLWQLGTTTVDRFGGNSLLNCWMIQMNKLDAFEFLFENLMLGGGVGFSVRREDVHELPKVKSDVVILHQDTKDATIIVPDSREGWVMLLHHVLKAFFVNGKSFTYSTVLVRGKGELIKGFGGKASGPKILVDGINQICKIIKGRESKKLRSIDVLDICNIIGSIVVSGNVRRSAQIALGDPDDYLFLRAKRWDVGNIPNFRAMSNNTITADAYDHIMEQVWDGYAGNGEPYGFFNLPLARKFGRLKDGPLRDSNLYPTNEDNVVGLNPCITGDTLIAVADGRNAVSVKQLVEENKDIPIYCQDAIASQKGKHKVVVKMGRNPRLTSKNNDVYKITLDDGSSVKATINHKFMMRDGSYKELKDLKINDSLMPFNTEIQNGYKIINIEYSGKEDVYNLTVDDNHNYMIITKYNNDKSSTGICLKNCGEITLADYECCNLCELYLNNIKSQEELVDCALLLYKTQKAINALPFIHDETNKIVHKNMRIGLGITGICQSLDKLDWLDKCYIELRKFDKNWSKAKGWPESIKLTTTKPSGTLSLLAGASAGVHPLFDKHYIRRVRMSSNDKLSNICRDLGYKVDYAMHQDGSINRDTVIIEFPCKTENGILAAEMSAIKQLELVKQIQTIWSDNAVSVTVYYKKDELTEIKKWLKEHYKDSLKSVSFVLHSEHGFLQPPYESITEEEYNNKVKDLKPLEININGGEILDSLECSSGACPIR